MQIEIVPGPFLKWCSGVSLERAGTRSPMSHQRPSSLFHTVSLQDPRLNSTALPVWPLRERTFHFNMSGSATPERSSPVSQDTVGTVETPGKELLAANEKTKSEPEAVKQLEPPKSTSAPSVPLSLSGIKIKKRTVVTAAESEASPAPRSTSTSPPPAPQSNGFSRRANRDVQKPAAVAQVAAQKPSWMTDEGYSKVTERSTAPHGHTDTYYGAAGEPPRKLMRPSRRGDVQHQTYLAREERERAEKHGDEQSRIEEEIRRKAQNLDVTVRDHYNQRTAQSKREKRYLSPIIKLRNFNNVIKHILINTYGHQGDRVLDLGCGKGGDLRKWESAKISQYLGIDISNASITEAVRRYKRNFSPFEVTFVTGDAFGTPLPIVLREFPMIQFPVDIVSMQFCLHYAFETAEKARMTIENVARSLKPGGTFIGTIPNSEFIASKIRHLPPGSRKFGNSIYSVTFSEDPPKSGEFDNPYGNMYNYYLKDAIDNVPEYIIQFEDLRALCDEFGLRLKYKKSFAEFFREYIPEWYKRLSPNVVDGIKRSDGSVGVEKDESEAAAQFYVAFAFVKAG